MDNSWVEGFKTDNSWVEGFKLVGSAAGIISGAFLVYDRFIRGRPQVYLATSGAKLTFPGLWSMTRKAKPAVGGRRIGGSLG